MLTNEVIVIKLLSNDEVVSGQILFKKPNFRPDERSKKITNIKTDSAQEAVAGRVE
jgi:hypothetical protein